MGEILEELIGGMLLRVGVNTPAVDYYASSVIRS